MANEEDDPATSAGALAGTPFKWGGRDPADGLDDLGLVLAAANWAKLVRMYPDGEQPDGSFAVTFNRRDSDT